MLKNIEKLDEYKKKEIKQVLDIILKIGKKDLNPEKIIVYWDYIKQNHITSNLVREWDILVDYTSVLKIFIVTRKTAQEKNLTISRNILSTIKNEKNIRSEVNIIVEDRYSFNKWLKEKRYFYLDIINNGEVIYDSWKIKNFKKEIISEDEIKKIKKQDFSHFFNLSWQFILDYKNAVDRKCYKLAIFYLHQVAELLITCYLLVKIWYKPKTHDLEILYTKLKQESNSFNNWFNLQKEEYYFELLRWAYINSRYKLNYSIEKKDLDVLYRKTKKLSENIKKQCLLELK